MLDLIEYENLKRYKRYLTTDLNTKSKLYFDKKLIHKIPNEIDSKLRFVLEYIDKLNLKELIELKKVIYSKNDFVGYSMINYKEYKSLNKLGYRNFDLKKEDSFKLLQIFINLKKNNLAYKDFHKGNILLNTKTNDIKICDLDSFNYDTNYFLNGEELRKIFLLILSYLYNVREYDIRNIFNSSGIEIENSFINLCSNKYNFIDLNKIYTAINYIKQEYCIEERRHIISKSKQLSETGYSKYLRH